LGEYFTVAHQYGQALDQFEIARSAQPNNAALRSAIGTVLGNRGRWDEAISEHKAAAELDPRSANTARDLGDALYRAGRYAEAEAQFDRAIELAPDQILPYIGKIDLYIYALGDREGALKTVRQGSERMGRLAFAANLLSQDYVYFRTLDDGFGDLLDELSIGSFGRDTVSFFFYHLAKGRLNEERKQPETARAYYDSARVVLEDGLRRWPNDPFWRRELGVALAGLGRQDDAIREALRSTELVPMSKNAVLGSQNAESLARVYAMVGEHDAAVDQLESVMSSAPWYSARYLQIDPIWETLYDHPRFRRLVGQQD
jgi:tetratricopeptide (TPR) repeat protein